MNRHQSLVAAKGTTDDHDRLISADELLADLQEACGGKMSGTLAVPELLDLVRQCREQGLRIARPFSALYGEDTVSGFVRIHPLDNAETDGSEGGSGCEILIENWLSAPDFEEGGRGATQWLDEADRATAEITAHLDADQAVRALSSHSPDAEALAQAIDDEPGKIWSDYIALDGIAHEQPLHWRLLDGAKAKVPGSARSWRVRLLPIGLSPNAPQGFELLLIAKEPLSETAKDDDPSQIAPPEHSRLIGSALTPVLRQPIARIVANAETIHARLAGPLRDEYSEYAANIAAAGQHLSGMLDDLADLEVVEAPGFKTSKDRVDIRDIAKRAAGILGVRASARDISVSVEAADEPLYATAEFRRVLQILINLIGNAIAYSPEGSSVSVTSWANSDDTVSLSVIDQGPGVTPEQSAKIFEKFERLGRDSDGGNDTGSGLGLYISRKLALAMGGDLEVLQPPVDEDLVGAEFKLTLPKADT